MCIYLEGQVVCPYLTLFSLVYIEHGAFIHTRANSFTFKKWLFILLKLLTIPKIPHEILNVLKYCVQRYT